MELRRKLFSFLLFFSREMKTSLIRFEVNPAMNSLARSLTLWVGLVGRLLACLLEIYVLRRFKPRVTVERRKKVL